eukprot:TRINITY_DN1148_c0_g1_i1.p1 TRINITY_DN1148_c0_g1~~TRINITY_DN1148_c0_g1_i1.p1  ORF type:complete len:458 (+),score=56.28 TRINITY_DN1148_c0_g1_i1:37-1374(+)
MNSFLQPTLNIGTLGHVAHGKSTIVKAISGVKTNHHSKEEERNMTIKLGYANAKIFECPNCPKPQCYQSFGSQQNKLPKCRNSRCNCILQFRRHVSFVDCPGHEQLMTCMLNGAAAMDCAILVIAANEKCPQPQTMEHLVAAELMGLQDLAVVQNKVDLCKNVGSATQNYSEICELVKNTAAEGAPVFPTSAQLKIGIDFILQYIVEQIPQPEHDRTSPPRFPVIRSFDINRPGVTWQNLRGGVLGGTLQCGTLSIGTMLEIRPGLVEFGKPGKNGQPQVLSCKPIFTVVQSLYSEKNALKEATPGGLIGVGTSLDPGLTRDDGLVGQVAGEVGSLPPVFNKLILSYRLMKRVVGEEKLSKMKALAKGEKLLLSVGSITTKGTILTCDRKSRSFHITLDHPVCADFGQKCAISRSFSRKWRLTGWGKILPESPALVIDNSFDVRK